MPHDQLVVSINFVEFRYAEIARNKFVRGVVSWERFLDAEDQCHNTPRAGYAIRTGSVRYSKYCIAPFRTVALSSQCTLRGRSLVSVTGTSSYSPRDIRTLTTALLYLMKILQKVQNPITGTVPSHLTTLRLRSGMAQYAILIRMFCFCLFYGHYSKQTGGRIPTVLFWFASPWVG